MSGKSYQTNAQQSSQLFVKIEEFFDKERAPLLSAKKGGEGREWKQMGDKPRFWTGGGGTGKNGKNIMKQETAKKAIGQSAKFLRWGKECAALFPVAGCWKMRLQQKNLPPGGFSGLYNMGVFRGGFSLTKAPSFAIRNSDCKIHPQRRLNDREFRALRSSTKGFAFGNHSLLKKAGENFYFFHTNLVPRGSE